MTNKSMNPLHYALTVLLPSTELVDHVWDYEKDSLNMDRFLDPKSSFLHLCLNKDNIGEYDANLQMPVQKAITELITTLTQKDKQSYIWDIWRPEHLYGDSYYRALDAIDNLDKTTIQKNIDGIQQILNDNLGAWTIYDNLMCYALPLLEDTAKKTVWKKIHEESYTNEPSIALGTLKRMFTEATTEYDRELILNYAAYEFARTKHESIHPVLNELNDLNTLNIPEPLVQTIMNAIEIPSMLTFLSEHSAIARERLPWSKTAWSILNSPINANLHEKIDELLGHHIRSLHVDVSSENPIEFWLGYDGLVFLPNITKWCLDYYNQYDYYPDASTHFAAYVHGFESSNIPYTWLKSYTQRQEYHDSIGYRDWSLQQYSEHESTQWLRMIMMTGDKLSNIDELRESIPFTKKLHSLEYIPGSLIHPNEWTEALVQGRTNVQDIELRILLKRWFPDADYPLVDELKRIHNTYESMMNMDDISTWKLMFQELQNIRQGHVVQPLSLDNDA